MSKNNTKDALGNEIVFGEKYGYSSNHGVMTSVKIGIAIKFTPKGLLTMTVEINKKAAYNEELTLSHDHKMISVKPACLFPIDREIKI